MQNQTQMTGNPAADGPGATEQPICSFCGHETWNCSHGGHCFSWNEFNAWQAKFGESEEMTPRIRKLINNFVPEEAQN